MSPTSLCVLASSSFKHPSHFSLNKSGVQLGVECQSTIPQFHGEQSTLIFVPSSPPIQNKTATIFIDRICQWCHFSNCHCKHKKQRNQKSKDKNLWRISWRPFDSLDLLRPFNFREDIRIARQARDDHIYNPNYTRSKSQKTHWNFGWILNIFWAWRLSQWSFTKNLRWIKQTNKNNKNN